VHPVLRLLEVVADDGQSVGAEEVPLHQLRRGLDVGAEADAEHGEAAAAGEEVAALEVSWGLDGSHDLIAFVVVAKKRVEEGSSEFFFHFRALLSLFSLNLSPPPRKKNISSPADPAC
jgi:hypothetical protein